MRIRIQHVSRGSVSDYWDALRAIEAKYGAPGVYFEVIEAGYTSVRVDFQGASFQVDTEANIERFVRQELDKADGKGWL